MGRGGEGMGRGGPYMEVEQGKQVLMAATGEGWVVVS